MKACKTMASRPTGDNAGLVLAGPGCARGSFNSLTKVKMKIDIVSRAGNSTEEENSQRGQFFSIDNQAPPV